MPEDLNARHASEQTASFRRYDQPGINSAFGQFLGIGRIDRSLLQRYHNDLIEGGEEFVEAFYAYLREYPATAEILNRYREGGGKIESLVQTQMQHLWGLLGGHTDDKSAEHLAHIGVVHQRFGIEPVWVMGGYLLYWNHLRSRVRDNPAISSKDAPALESAIAKFIFRDMGLMLEGYWGAAMQATEAMRRKVEELQQQVTGLLANLPQILWSIDVVQNRLLYASPAARHIDNPDPDVPVPYFGSTLPEDREIVRQAWRQALGGEQIDVVSRLQVSGETPRWYRCLFLPFRDATGRVVRIDGLMEDTTDARAAHERLRELATTDSLTGLHNRTLFSDRLDRAIAAARHSATDHEVVLMLLDLDRFKEINDTLGHPTGDAVLRLVAKRLASTLRESDTIARLGGDEFAILLPEASDGRKMAEKVTRNLVGCFQHPFIHDGRELYLGASIGIAVFPEHGEDGDTLMSRADVAMYAAKHTDAPSAFYDPASDPNTPQRLALIADLRHALERNEFVLHYQPQIDLKRRRVTGVEALIRWNHPQRGPVPPDQFLPLAERTGLINPVTDWVLGEALRQCRSWHSEGLALRVAVNMTARSFQQPDLAAKIEDLIGRSNATPDCLEIEITEQVLLSDIERTSVILGRLSDMGITIAVDDYGTGCSSLAYLKRLPLHTLKIDKSFVLNMANDENDAVIVRSTVELAHNLGYRVVAEGVEDEAALNLLEILGCDIVQGFFVSRPMEAARVASWLRDCSWNIGDSP